MTSEDITYCANERCPMVNCCRNQANIKNPNALHSFAYFHDCDKYPPMEFSKEEQQKLKEQIMRGDTEC